MVQDSGTGVHRIQDQMQVNHTKERYNSNLATKQASYYHQLNFQNKTEGIVEQ